MTINLTIPAVAKELRPKITVLGVGVETDALVELSERHFGGWAAAEHADARIEASWKGESETHEDATDPLMHVGIGLDGPSAHPRDESDLLAAAVVAVLLGGGGSFSASGSTPTASAVSTWSKKIWPQAPSMSSTL